MSERMRPYGYRIGLEHVQKELSKRIEEIRKTHTVVPYIVDGLLEAKLIVHSMMAEFDSLYEKAKHEGDDRTLEDCKERQNMKRFEGKE